MVFRTSVVSGFPDTLCTRFSEKRRGRDGAERATGTAIERRPRGRYDIVGVFNPGVLGDLFTTTYIIYGARDMSFIMVFAFAHFALRRLPPGHVDAV